MINKWYRIIGCDNSVPNPYVATSTIPLMEDEWQFMRGLRKGPSCQHYSFVVDSPDMDGDPDDVLQNFLTLPVFSCRLRNELRRLQLDSCIEYVPIDVVRFDQTTIDGYSIANIRCLSECMDIELSDYSHVMRGGSMKITGIRKLVLKDNALPSDHIYRLSQHTMTIICSDSFQKCFTNGRFTGYSFDPVVVSTQSRNNN
jgi:hypothetical protein